MDWDIDAAVEAYANIRPPGIYKQQYVNDLYIRYDGSADDAWKVTEIMPEWSLSNMNGDDHDEDVIPTDEKMGVDSRQKRFIESDYLDKKFREEELVVQVFDQPRLGNIQRLAKTLMKTDKNGFIGCQPVSMTQDNIKMLSEKNYHVSWKADGTRYLLLIVGRDRVYMLDRDNAVFMVKNLSFPKSNDLTKHLEKSLFDGELIVDRDKNNLDPKTGQAMEYPRFLLYDSIVFKENEVGKARFDIRIECITNEIIIPRDRAKRKGIINSSLEPFGIRLKPFKSIQDPQGRWREYCHDSWAKKLTHETDGLIFQPSSKTDFYKVGRCDDILKWKPPELNTIDFKLVIRKTKVAEGCLSEKVGYLYCSGETNHIDIIKVVPPLNRMDGKIIECKFEFDEKIIDGKKMKQPKGWVFLRERTDKSFPNHISTALGVRDSIVRPVHLNDLMNYIEKRRFSDQSFRAPGGTLSPSKTNKRHMPLDGPRLDGDNLRKRNMI